MKTRRSVWTLFMIPMIVFVVLASLPPALATEGAAAQEESVFDKVQWQHGPAEAEMEKWASIKVQEGYIFADGDDTRMLMEAMGNPSSGREVGFLSPDTLGWFVVFEFDDVGYIKDDDKDDLDADAMLESIRAGTEESNKVRREKGFSGLNITGWEVKPNYNEATHNLEWAIRAKDDGGDLILNHNTRILGRRGVMRVTLVVNPEQLQAVLPVYTAQLDAFSFSSGETYAEFVQGDKIAKYGLTALVAGGAGAAAAKLGLFKVLAKFGKFIFIAVVAFFGVFWGRIKKLFGGGDKGKRTMPASVRKDLQQGDGSE